jgi:hypothetical protein
MGSVRNVPAITDPKAKAKAKAKIAALYNDRAKNRRPTTLRAEAVHLAVEASVFARSSAPSRPGTGSCRRPMTPTFTST